MNYNDTPPPRWATDDEIRAFAQRYRDAEPGAHSHSVHLAGLTTDSDFVLATVHWDKAGHPVTRETIRPA
jgi:hypothetical protein